MKDAAAIREAIQTATGTMPSGDPTPVEGGCINEAFRLGDFFVKSNTPNRADLFTAEAEGLKAIARTATVRVPQVVCSGTTASSSFLVLEHLPLVPLSAAAQEMLGQQLAALHHHSAPHFGWSRDNYIGATPQSNTPTASWSDFCRHERLTPLLRRLRDQGTPLRDADQLLDRLPLLLPGPDPVPSLLHGDLWGGNAAALPDGTPVLFDPAPSFGDREADLAMTELFGGFSPVFHAAYREAWPINDDYLLRRTLYNLYHLLNHAVLFGSGYLPQCQSSIDTLLNA